MEEGKQPPEADGARQIHQGRTLLSKGCPELQRLRRTSLRGFDAVIPSSGYSCLPPSPPPRHPQPHHPRDVVPRVNLCPGKKDGILNTQNWSILIQSWTKLSVWLWVFLCVSAFSQFGGLLSSETQETLIDSVVDWGSHVLNWFTGRSFLQETNWWCFCCC